MATIGTYNLTLSDITQQTAPDGSIADVINIMSQTNDILQDMTFQPCNDGTAHQDTIVTGLPQGAWVRYNEGRQPAKGVTAPIRAQTGILELPMQVDRRLAERRGKGNVSKVMSNQLLMAVEGLNQQMATALAYEDERTNPERITGFMPHYSTVSTATAASAENVIDCGGTGSDNMSILIIGWGDAMISGILPEGAPHGVKRGELKIVDVVDSTGISGGTFEAYKQTLEFNMGLMVKDWRYGVRLANIDVSNLEAESSNADLWKAIIRGLERIPNLSACRPAIYMNRKARTWLRIQALSKSAYQTTFETVAGKPVMMIDGVPVRRMDSLLNTEARVV